MVAESTLTEAKCYLRDMLGGTAVSDPWATPWPEASQLPFFLQNLYTYYQAELLGCPCLLMLSRTPEGETPAVVRKHWQAVAKHFKGDVIYLIKAVSSYNRKRLIEQQVPFLVPGNQLYLPMLGVDLREYFRSGRQEEKAHLSAAAQMVVLREILQNDCSGQPAKELAQRLNYSPMTITRAIKELQGKQLAVVKKVGREKHLHFQSSGEALWDAAKPSLQSPVKKRIWAIDLDREEWTKAINARIAGESALAQYTMLNDPGVRVWAVNASEWPGLKKLLRIQELEREYSADRSQYRYDQGVSEVELWTYNPAIIDDGEHSYRECVDPLSLWLSCESNTDERIEMARESLLEKIWSRSQW